MKLNKEKFTKQGVRDINPTNRQPNGRLEKQHQFEDATREEFDAEGRIYEVKIRCCKHCNYELEPYTREIDAHLQVSCRRN